MSHGVASALQEVLLLLGGPWQHNQPTHTEASWRLLLLKMMNQPPAACDTAASAAAVAEVAAAIVVCTVLWHVCFVGQLFGDVHYVLTPSLYHGALSCMLSFRAVCECLYACGTGRSLGLMDNIGAQMCWPCTPQTPCSSKQTSVCFWANNPAPLFATSFLMSADTCWHRGPIGSIRSGRPLVGCERTEAVES